MNNTLKLATRLVEAVCAYDYEAACEDKQELIDYTLEEMQTPEGLKELITGLLDIIDDLQEV